MPDKLAIETYCNRYEELCSIVNSIGIGSLSSVDTQKLLNVIPSIKQYLNQTTNKTSSCGALSDNEKSMYGILPTEVSDIDKLSKEINVDPNELFYYLVCAKMPYYMSKVERSLKNSFVDAASSLYYIERFYLFSAISKLFELKSQVNGGILTDESTCKLINDCIALFQKDQIDTSLLSFIQMDMDRIDSISYRRIEFLSDEISIISRALFFYYSTFPATISTIKAIANTTSSGIGSNSLMKKIQKDEIYRYDTNQFALACIDSLILLIMNHQSQYSKDNQFTESDLLSILQFLESPQLVTTTRVLQLAVAIVGLQKNNHNTQFRGCLRKTLRFGVFTILYHDLLFIHSHYDDTNYLLILSSLFYDTVISYLSIQSTQWHTISSKQYTIYEDEVSNANADGLEHIVYCLEYILSKLPGLQIILSGTELHDNIMPYFCTMISDRLRAEPYLFNTYIRLLTAIAKTSTVSADSVYSFIDKAPSELVSWPIMLHSLNEVEKLLQGETAQRGLLDQDLTGFIYILDLITAVMKNATSCPNILSNMQIDTIQLFLRLLHQPIHILLKAKILAVCTCYAQQHSYAMLLLSQLEYGRILTNDNSSGIRFEFTNIESQAGIYPITSEFLRFIIQLTNTCSIPTLMKSSCFPSIIDFLLHCILNQIETRTSHPLRCGEKNEISCLCYQFLSLLFSYFSTVYHDKENPENRIILERFCMILSEFLCFGEIMTQVLKYSTLQPHHVILNRTILSTDYLSENQIFIDFDLLNDYSIQLQLVQQSLLLIRQLLEITPEMICELALFDQSSKTSLVSSLSSHLLTDSSTTIMILFNISKQNVPSIQYLSLQILKLLVEQVNTSLFITLFDSYPVEATTIRTSINQLFIHGLFNYKQDICQLVFPTQSGPLGQLGQLNESQDKIQSQSIQLILDLLIAYGQNSFPSIVSSLLLLPQSFSISHMECSLSTLFNTLLTFLETPSLVAFHPLAASKAVHFIYLLCLHHDKSLLTELCSILIDRQVFFRLLSAFPFLLEHASQIYIPQLGGQPQFISSFQPYQLEEILGLYSLLYYSYSILTILLYQQKKYHIGLQLLSDEIRAIFTYMENIRTIFVSSEIPAPSTSPLLDSLSLLDQSYSEPSNKPSYINDVIEGCWIQRERETIKYYQIDLLQLAKNIQFSLNQKPATSIEEIKYFVKEASDWCYQWNVFMEIETFKSLVFKAGCSLLHINLIENRESISLLSEYSNNPTDLSLAVIQAVLSIMSRTQTFDRPYLQSILSLLLDLFTVLTVSHSIIPPFTQQAVLLSLLQMFLSPLIQQQQGDINQSLRSSFYLVLHAFLLYAVQANSLSFLLPSFPSSLDIFTHTLLKDISSLSSQLSLSALMLLNYLLITDLKESLLPALLHYEVELQNLISCLHSIQPAVFQQSLSQDSISIPLIQNIFIFFTNLASTTQGAIFLLNNSIFTHLTSSPFLLLNAPAGYPVYPTKLSSIERNNIRLLLKPLFQFILTLVETVRNFRGLRNEIIQFIMSSVNLSSIILEDRDPDELLALEVLALYEAILSLVACKKELLKEELHGFEEVVAAKLLEILKSIKEDKKMCENIRNLSENTIEKKEENQKIKKERKKLILMKSIIEYSIIYLHNYGEIIPAELLKSLGY